MITTTLHHRGTIIFMGWMHSNKGSSSLYQTSQIHRQSKKEKKSHVTIKQSLKIVEKLMKKRFHFFGMIWSGSIIQDHSELSASKEAINPFLQWVYRLLWCTMIRKGWWLRFVFRWPYANKFPTHMVRMFCSGKLRMRKQNAKTTVPLDVVPERRTKRCSPRFRPGGPFWSQVSDTCHQAGRERNVGP